MERITYRKTLDVHKNGIQFLLQGFETADNMSRVIEISLMASGDAIDFPLERVIAMMYVTTPSALEPSINACEIKDNKVVYEVLPIVEEGITTMQLKIIETSPEGATSVLASPKFSVEVTKSNLDDGDAQQNKTFTALEDATAKAKAVYDERFLRMELTSDCIFKAYYADGTEYETDILKKLFYNGNVELSESFAKGGTGVRAGEDTDNSKYYSEVSKSEALKAKEIMTNSEDILEEVKLHGVYTAFSVDFETGEVVYVSPSFKFTINQNTGELDSIGQSYTFDDEVGRVVSNWLGENGIILSDIQNISKNHTEKLAEHSEKIEDLTTEVEELTDTVGNHTEQIEELNVKVIPIEQGGTGAVSTTDALDSLSVQKISTISSYMAFLKNDNANVIDAAFGKNNDDNMLGIGKALGLYANFKGETVDTSYLNNYDKFSEIVKNNKVDLIKTPSIYNLITSSSYASNVLRNTNTELPDIVLYNKGQTDYLNFANATIESYKNGTSNYEHTIDVSSRISISKTISANETSSVTAFKYTIPLLKDLPDLRGYGYLNVKLSNDKTSSLPQSNSTVYARISVGGIQSTMFQTPKGTPIDITGSNFKDDLFTTYVTNPTAKNILLQMNFCGWNTGETGKSATLNLNIDKIWISET